MLSDSFDAFLKEDDKYRKEQMLSLIGQLLRNYPPLQQILNMRRDSDSSSSSSNTSLPLPVSTQIQSILPPLFNHFPPQLSSSLEDVSSGNHGEQTPARKEEKGEGGEGKRKEGEGEEKRNRESRTPTLRIPVTIPLLFLSVLLFLLAFSSIFTPPSLYVNHISHMFRKPF